MVNVHEVRRGYEKQSQVQAALTEELAFLKQINQLSLKGQHGVHRGKKGQSRSMSPNARMERIHSLEDMLSMSSTALKQMASQLSESEERERYVLGRGRWNHIRSMGDAKNLLQYVFNAAAEGRCQVWEKEKEINDMKEQMSDLTSLLQQSEAQNKELMKEQKIKEQAVAMAMATPSLRSSRGSSKHCVDDKSCSNSQVSLPAPKQLKFTPGIFNGSVGDTSAFLDQTQKVMQVGQLSIKKVEVVGQSVKLWKWKRSHHQWLLQFKWKWQKPWKLSEWIKHNDETLMRSRPRQQALIDLI